MALCLIINELSVEIEKNLLGLNIIPLEQSYSQSEEVMIKHFVITNPKKVKNVIQITIL